MAEKIDPGMAHLFGQANKKQAVDADSSRCWKIHIMLSGQVFFLSDPSEGGKWGPTEAGMKFIDIYSEGAEKTVIRHPVFTVVGTGFTMDYVKKPEWWDRRNSGGI